MVPSRARNPPGGGSDTGSPHLRRRGPAGTQEYGLPHEPASPSEATRRVVLAAVASVPRVEVSIEATGTRLFGAGGLPLTPEGSGTLLCEWIKDVAPVAELTGQRPGPPMGNTE